MDLVIGFLALFVAYGVSNLFNLPVLHEIMVRIMNVAVLAVLIIFQPELRMALSKLSLKGRRKRSTGQFDPFIEQLSTSVFRMSSNKTGAIIVLENNDTLEEYAHNGIMLTAQFSSELLESIFTRKSPIHDGAVIIREGSILAAASILPLAQNTQQLKKTIGTRHRAGLGISEITDSLVVIISEETGKVSIARDGIMTRGLKEDRFKGIIRSIFHPPKLGIRSSNIREWLKQ